MRHGSATASPGTRQPESGDFVRRIARAWYEARSHCQRRTPQRAQILRQAAWAPCTRRRPRDQRFSTPGGSGEIYTFFATGTDLLPVRAMKSRADEP
jgi:hypothetical protein